MTAVILKAAVIDYVPACRFASELLEELNGTVNAEMEIVAIDLAHETPAFVVCQPVGGNGYFIVTTSEEPKLLAYSETTNYSSDLFPEYFRQQLDNYADRLSKDEIILEEDGPKRAPQGERAVATRISPLCSSKWAQDEPYNNMCPEDNGTHSVTGCTATAMAQVMYYHKYPSAPTGTGKATLNNQSLTLDFSQYTFDWDNMIDEYKSGGYTEAQANAVATLMMCCGYGANMSYSASESGAYPSPARVALIKNFGYSSSAKMYMWKSYENSRWLKMIEEELQAGRPIIYTGRTSTRAGHSFVCDGRGLRNTIHINWGWGYGDGNVDVDLMNPQGQSDGYNQSVEVIMGIQPQKEGEDREISYCFNVIDSLKFTPSNKMIVIPAIYNLNPDNISIDIAMSIYRGTEFVSRQYFEKNKRVGYETNSNPIWDTFRPSALGDGDYCAQLEVRIANEDLWLRPEAGDRPTCIEFSISGGQMEYKGTTTSLDNVPVQEVQNSSNATYRLDGTRADLNSKGMLIRNGKVIFVK